MMAKLVSEYTDGDWSALSEQHKADAWRLTIESLKRTLERFDAGQPHAKAQWDSLKAALKAAIRALEEHLRKASGD
jgi:hypothetical protein